MSPRSEPRHLKRRFVRCPELVTGPVLSPKALALGLVPNTVCGARCEVHNEAPVMTFSCPRGHMFVVGTDEIEVA